MPGKKSPSPLKLSELKRSKNIAALLTEEELNKIGQQVIAGYDIDKESRAEWEDVNEKAMDIAKQVLETKNFPFPNASNIKFPLITKGSIDFASRMLPEIVKNDKTIKISACGKDPEGLIALRARRVQEFSNYQLLKKSDDWEDSLDRILHALPVMGTMFKKTYYDPILEMPVSEMCLPLKVVINYNAASLERARRVTHEITVYENDIIERIRAKLYSDIDVKKLRGSDVTDDQYDPPIDLLEQHCYIDLDEDGYKEPYIVVMHKASQQILRIVNRFNKIRKNGQGEVKRITPIEYFTDFHFLKSPDGGFYSVGFGTLLYPLNASINTLLNQLIDSGTLHNQQGGLIGRGLRIRGGEIKIKMGSYQPVDAAMGSSLRENIFPFPTKEPSTVLFQLLGLLIEIGKDLTSTNEALEGKAPAQNVAATTMLTLVEQGMKVYNAITKRLFRALKKELKKIFELNRMHLTDEEYREVLNEPKASVKEDFEVESYDILPVADPNMASDAQRNAKAQAIMGIPGLNTYESTKYFLESLQLDQPLIDKLLPKPDPNAPPPPEAQKVMAEIEKLKAQAQEALASAEDLKNKNEIEYAKLDILKQSEMVRARESAARTVKMENDTLHGDQKLALAGAKADHEARLEELNLAQEREVKEAELSLKAMERVTKAHEAKSKINKETKEADHVGRDNQST